MIKIGFLWAFENNGQLKSSKKIVKKNDFDNVLKMSKCKKDGGKCNNEATAGERDEED